MNELMYEKHTELVTQVNRSISALNNLINTN